MPPQTLIPPADLPAIGFPMLLRVALCRLDGGAAVDEEEGGHGDSSDGGDDSLVVIVRHY